MFQTKYIHPKEERYVRQCELNERVNMGKWKI